MSCQGRRIVLVRLSGLCQIWARYIAPLTDRLLLLLRTSPLYQRALAQTLDCRQNAVSAFELCCPCIENALTL